MKLKYDSNLDYQLEAISAVTDLFEGLPPKQSDYEISFSSSYGSLDLEQTELGIGNQLLLASDNILSNLQSVQARNNIAKSNNLIDDTYTFPNYSVEMETGTGKTYVYLRTIFELNKLYGFKKFIIVVPSIAIREGVLSSIDLMKDHLSSLYNNVPFDHFVYNSQDLNKVRQFAISNEIQMMIINIQAFQKDAGDIKDYATLTDDQRKKLNVIHQEQDKMSGRKPIEFVRATNPIVIIDEPQSVDNTPKAKRAISTLNPLLALRYSATHINPYNLLYKLDPIKAYDMKLVKQIEVSSIRSEQDYSEAFIRLDSVGYARNATIPHAKVTVHVDTREGPKEKQLTLKQGTDISQKTSRSGYDGYLVTAINAESGFERVEFSNGKTLYINQEEGGMGEEVLKAQIYQAVEEHFKKERRYQGLGIKVLSLFFVDKVANYRWYDEDGNRQKGKIAVWFEEAYSELSEKPLFKGLLQYSAEEVHDGYFSADRKKGKIVSLKDTSGSTQADDDTYHLIMKDKERLLTNEEPLRFIFSHSALKEGWDNPNVFQICSLREMGTDRQRRQTLGRGMRLPVNQNGDRIFDDSVNKLTVIASESFEEYARGLQEDIENDCNIKFGRIEKIAFAQIPDKDLNAPLGQEASENVWNALVRNGYLNNDGDITDKFTPEKEGFALELPDELMGIRPEITDEIKRYIFKNRIVNSRDKKPLKYNKRVELNEEFQNLWKKINQKTKYAVEFKTDELVNRAASNIKEMEAIHSPKLITSKTETKITQAGVEGGKVLDSKTELLQTRGYLPDILAYLQRETELTRKTLVDILKKSERLKDFTVNPQAFMTEASKHISKALSAMVTDGIKYEILPGQSYEMRLFEFDENGNEREMIEYMNKLHEIQSKDNRTLYDYVVVDSTVEREVAEKLDSHENVKFFCKLPRWFVVPTPVGNYNPDWAVVTERDEKLYLIRETKSTHDSDKRRTIENQKIKCGKAHFDKLGVNFKVAINIDEVLEI